MQAPNIDPRTHTLPASLLIAEAVNTVPLPATPVLGVELPVVLVPNPPIVAIMLANPVVVVLPKNALKASVVLPSMTTDEPPDSREYVVPETVMGDPPAERVCEPMT
jgi:hypothetical protein